MREETEMIFSKDRKILINPDNLTVATISATYIHAHLTDGSNVTLGNYSTEERAEEVLMEMGMCIEDGIAYFVPEG